MKYVTLSNYMSILEKEAVTDKYEPKLVRSLEDEHWVLYLQSREYKGLEHAVSCLDYKESLTYENFITNVYQAIQNMSGSIDYLKTREDKDES